MPDFDLPLGAQRVGLTGGIGSGKSSVARILAMLGAFIIDSDAISRALTAAGGAAMPEITVAFGDRVIRADGALDRIKMRELVYSDPNHRIRLESIVHPLVAAETVKQAEAAKSDGAKCTIFDIPLLVESGRWRQQLDRVLVVDCLPTSQVSRVMSRSGLDSDTVRKIMASQVSRCDRLRAADDVIFNDGITLVQLETEVKRWALAFGLSSR